MPRDSRERVSKLIVARMQTSMRLSEWFLQAACYEDAIPDLSEWIDMRDVLRQFEYQSIALYHRSGYSWENMSNRYGVTKQSLHEKLSDASDDELENAQASFNDNLRGVRENLRSINNRMRRFSVDVENAAQLAQMVESSTVAWAALRTSGQRHGDRAYAGSRHPLWRNTGDIC